MGVSISPDTIKVLTAIDKAGSLSATEIAGVIGEPLDEMRRKVQHMARIGLIFGEPQRGSSKQYSLTAAGELVLGAKPVDEQAPCIAPPRTYGNFSTPKNWTPPAWGGVRAGSDAFLSLRSFGMPT